MIKRFALTNYKYKCFSDYFLQLIASGVRGLTGICAREAVAEECKEELDRSSFRNEMEEKDVKETHWK